MELEDEHHIGGGPCIWGDRWWVQWLGDCRHRAGPGLPPGASSGLTTYVEDDVSRHAVKTGVAHGTVVEVASVVSKKDPFGPNLASKVSCKPDIHVLHC
jgi:hypothetical protein